MAILIVVESPVKAKHIAGMLGPKYKVVATIGHIRDLPQKEMGIDIENGFTPQYVTVKGKNDAIKRIKEAAQTADRIILATDPDREGEAISWHVNELLNKALQKKVKRAEFNEITKHGIEHGLNNLRDIDNHMAMSQQTRRIMDRMVGFEISPLLWKHVKGYIGISAGRVQSCALKIIYDRQQEINKFEVTEYWSIQGTFVFNKNQFLADLIEWNSINIQESPIRSKDEVDNRLEMLHQMNYSVESKNQTNKAYPPPSPFITTSLLQHASSTLKFNSKKTMKIAQELFDGINEEIHGLITYMRTDSPRVSQEAEEAARKWIEGKYGPTYMPKVAHEYKAKESAQDAHECIRPTDLSHHPESLKHILSPEQLALYTLIFNRFVTSQMASAIHNEISSVILGCKEEDTARFRAFSSKIVFNGWHVMGGTSEELQYQEALSFVEEEQRVTAKKFVPKQHYTRPPAQYSEASLIKKLESVGVGRPSTYASIIDTLQTRKYVIIVKGSLLITEVGIKVVECLITVFPQILSAEFTYDMEKEIDGVSTGMTKWVEPVGYLYNEICMAKEGKVTFNKKSSLSSSDALFNKTESTGKKTVSDPKRKSKQSVQLKAENIQIENVTRMEPPVLKRGEKKKTAVVPISKKIFNIIKSSFT